MSILTHIFCHAKLDLASIFLRKSSGEDSPNWMPANARMTGFGCEAGA